MRLRFAATRRQVLGTILVMTGTFVAAMDLSVVGTAMPTVIGELGGIDRYGWVFSAYLLTSTATTPIFGRLADMFGRKPLYFGALVAFVAFSMLAGTSRSMDELIFYRALQGVGAGALLPIGFTMVGDLYDRRTRAKVIGLFSSVWVVAALAGPVIGAILTQTLSWRWTFYVNLPIGLAALALLVFTFRDTGEHHRTRVDWLGAAAFGTGAAALMLGLNGIAPALALPAAVALGVAFVVIERRTESPMIDLELVRRPLIATVLGLSLAQGVLQFGPIAYVPPFVQGVMGGQPADAGIALGGMSIGWSVSASLVGWILFRIGLRAVVAIGALVTLAGTAALALLSPASDLLAAHVASTIVGVGLGWSSAPVFVTAQTSVGYAQRGAVTSLIQFSRTLGGAIGVAALGTVLNLRVGPLANDASLLLDPSRGAAGLDDAARLAFADGLHLVYVGLVVVAVASIFLALLLPSEMPPEVAHQPLAPSS